MYLDFDQWKSRRDGFESLSRRLAKQRMILLASSPEGADALSVPARIAMDFDYQ
jgi:hypothetical protein